MSKKIDSTASKFDIFALPRDVARLELKFLEPKSIADFNALMESIEGTFPTVDPTEVAEPSDTELSVLFELIRKSDAWLRTAREAIGALSFEEVTPAVKEYLARFQAKNDAKMIALVDHLLEKLKVISKTGLLPTSEKRRAEIQVAMDVVRQHLDGLEARADLRTDRKAVSSESDAVLDAVDKRIALLKEECKTLHMWQPLARSTTVIAEAGSALEQAAMVLDEFVEGFGVSFKFVGESAVALANAIDLKRALHADVEFRMAARTYKILQEHKDIAFSTPYARAEFLIALEAQRRRGLAALEQKAAQFKFIFQSKKAEGASVALAANETLLGEHKLAVAKELSEVVLLDYELAKQLNPALTVDEHQKQIEAAALRTLRLLIKLKVGSVGSRKNERLGATIDEYIHLVKSRYEHMFPGRELDIENNALWLRDQDAVQDFIVELKKTEAAVTRTANSIDSYGMIYVVKSKNAFATAVATEYADTIAKFDQAWTTMAGLLCDAEARRTGVPATAKRLLEKKQDMLARAQAIAERHEMLEKKLAEGMVLSRADYFADLTPYGLTMLARWIENSADSIDVVRAQKEIAFSMLERLLLAQLHQSADLLVAAAQRSEAYRLSDIDICFFMEFIEKYGDENTKAALCEKLGTASDMLARVSSPFERAFDAYRTAVTAPEQKNDVVFHAAVALSKVASWLPKQDAVTTDADKAAYSAAVAVSLSPKGILASDWENHVKTQRVEIKKETNRIKTVLRPATDRLTRAVAMREKSLTEYQNASGPRKFLKWVFSGFQGEATRKAALLVARTEANKATVALEEAERAHERTTQKLVHHEQQMVQHVVAQVKREVIAQKINADDILALRAFVEKHDPTALEALNRSLDFTQSFLVAICDHCDVDVLKGVLDHIRICQPNCVSAAERMLAVVQGKVTDVKELIADIRTLASLDIETADGLLVGKTDKSLVGAVFAAVCHDYVKPIILDSLALNEDVTASRIEMMRKQLSLFDADDQQAILAQFTQPAASASVDFSFDVDVDIETQSALLNAFYFMPAFSDLPQYKEMRDAAFATFFERRLAHVITLTHYTQSDYEADVNIMASAREALLASEDLTVTEIVLDRVLAKRLSELPKLKWNAQFAELIENHASDTVVNQYRLLRLRELLNDAILHADKAKAEEALRDFIETMCDRPGAKDYNALLAELVSSKTASWMSEWIVREYGTTEQLQLMHANWMQSELARLKEAPTERPETTEMVLQSLLHDGHDHKTTRAHLLSLVGKTHFPQIEKWVAEHLRALSEVAVAPQDLSVLETQSDFNALFHAEGDQVAAAIKRGYSPFLSELIAAFGFTASDYALRLKAELDLQVLAKEFASFAMDRIADVSRDGLDVRGTTAELLKPSEDRQVAKEAAREALRAAGASSTSVKALVTGVREYNYASNPDIYYEFYLLPAQKYCYQAVATEVTKLFDALKAANVQGVEGAQMANAIFKRLKNTVVDPLTHLDETVHVMPIIALLMDNVGGDVGKLQDVQALKSAILRLSDDPDAAAFCKAWCDAHPAENDAGLSAVRHYVRAAEQAAKIRQLSDGIAYFINAAAIAMESYLANPSDAPAQLEARFVEQLQAAAVTLRALLTGEDDTQLRGFLTSMMARFSAKIEQWLKSCEEELKTTGAMPQGAYIGQLLKAVVNAYGSSEQKQALVIFQNTTDILAALDESAVSSDTSAYNASLLKQGMLARLKNYDIAGQHTAELLKHIADYAVQSRDDAFQEAVSKTVVITVSQLIERKDYSNLILLLAPPRHDGVIAALKDKNELLLGLATLATKLMKDFGAAESDGFLKGIAPFLSQTLEYVLSESVKKYDAAVVADAKRVGYVNTSGVGMAAVVKDSRKTEVLKQVKMQLKDFFALIDRCDIHVQKECGNILRNPAFAKLLDAGVAAAPAPSRQLNLFADPAPKEAIANLIALRAAYAKHAKRRFGFTDTSKIFDKKGQTYEGAIAIMREKVVARVEDINRAKSETEKHKLIVELENSASYQTLVAVYGLKVDFTGREVRMVSIQSEPIAAASTPPVVIDVGSTASESDPRSGSPASSVTDDSFGGSSAGTPPITPRKNDEDATKDEDHRSSGIRVK